MASLSTCHLGLWLGWQILLNLVKSSSPSLLFLPRVETRAFSVAILTHWNSLQISVRSVGNSQNLPSSENLLLFNCAFSSQFPDVFILLITLIVHINVEIAEPFQHFDGTLSVGFQ